MVTLDERVTGRRRPIFGAKDKKCLVFSTLTSIGVRTLLLNPAKFQARKQRARLLIKRNRGTLAFILGEQEICILICISIKGNNRIY